MRKTLDKSKICGIIESENKQKKGKGKREMTALQVLEAISELNINQKFAFYTEIEGWTYAPDPTTWSGGTWYRDDHGSVNLCGGSFPNITRAVEAMDNHYRVRREFERVT